MATPLAVRFARGLVWISAIAAMLAAAYWLSPAYERGVSREPAPGTAAARSTSRGDLDSTIATTTARLAAAPGDGRAAVALSDALLRQARVTGNAGLAVRAEAVLTAVLARTPDHYESRRMLAAVYLSQHRFRDAIREATRCQQTRPGDAWTFGVLGDAHLELGDYPDAFAAFDRMAALRPDSSSYARASYARELQGDLDGALRLMTMAAEATAPQDPESLAWHYAQIGHLFLEMNRVDEARRAFEHANFVFPNHPFAIDGLARVEDAVGRTSAALALIAKRLAVSPSPADAAFAGELLERLGRTDEAERQYRLAEAGWRVDAPEPAKLARFLADHHRHVDEAVRLAEQACADRHDIFTEDALAWAYFKDGRLADARKAIARALRTGTRDREIHRHADAIQGGGMRIATAAIATLLALAGPAAAHPPGTTAVDLTLHADAFDAAITIDPAALRLKESALGRPLADLIDVSFDGRRAAVGIVPSPAGADRSLFLLVGRIPDHAHAVTVSSSLVYGAYPVTFLEDGHAPSVQWLSGFDATAPYVLGAGKAPESSGLLTYIALGFTHIVPNGVDHILFVLGLFFLTRRAGAVLAQVSAFTFAHSITLGLSVYGVVSLPARVVEPLIALSIAYVAVENLFTNEVRPWRLALVFAFGLLHGLGFAEALAHLHVPRASFLTTLFAFNAGVELGQLSVVAAAALLLRAVAVSEANYRRRVVWPVSAAIALTGLFWTVIRVI